MKMAFLNRRVWGRTCCLARAELTLLAFALAESSAAEEFGDFTYCVENEAVTITGYTGPGGPLSIPSEIEGLPVVAIGNAAFWNRGDLTGALILPDSVATIGASAFYECRKMSSLRLGSGVTNIEYYAFGYCKRLAGTLVIPDTVESIGSAAFYQCPQLTAVTFGSGLRSLGEFAFSDCGRLTGEVVLPSGVTAVERKTFYLCNELKGVKRRSRSPECWR